MVAILGILNNKGERMTKIAVLVGSLSEASINKNLANKLAALLPEGVTFEFANLHLPLFNYELEGDFPAEAQELKTLVESADGVLFVTPEYNRSFSGVLKNAIDWASRPWGSNSFAGKPAGIIGASISPLGTTQAQQQLRNVAIYLGTQLLGQPEMYVDASRAFNEDGSLADGAQELFQRYVDTFVTHVQKHA